MIRQNKIIDLTKTLDRAFKPYVNGRYSDPPLEISPWSSIEQDGFRVDCLSLGTQSGTHIDAPAHFRNSGVELDALRTDLLVGSYYLLDCPCDVETALACYGNETMLFLRSPKYRAAKMSRNEAKKILSLPTEIIVLSGDIVIVQEDAYAFHRLVAEQGKFLVEDLDEDLAHQVVKGGELFVFPLKIFGVSGSPCRVMVRGSF